ASLFAGSTFAGPAVAFKQSQPVVRDIPLDEMRAEVTQTFQSDFKRGHGFDPNEKSNNNTNTWHFEFEYDHRVSLNESWYLRLGLDVNRYDFGNNRSVAPNSLQSYAAVIALE